MKDSLQGHAQDKDRARTVQNIWLFTVSACPTGRSMGAVMREAEMVLKEMVLKEMDFRTVYVDAEPELANAYHVAVNPTVLFLDAQEEELYRLTGFHETDEIVNTAVRASHGERSAATEPDPGVTGSTETYTIYRIKDGSLVPVTVEYANPTAVKAPRLTAIRQLLTADVPGYGNPFPGTPVLQLAEFKEGKAVIHIRTSAEAARNLDQELAETSLQKTLEPFGIASVRLVTGT